MGKHALTVCGMASLQAELGDMPDLIVPPSIGGEFLVSRQRIRARPYSFYKNILQLFEVWRLHIAVHVTVAS